MSQPPTPPDPFMLPEELEAEELISKANALLERHRPPAFRTSRAALPEDDLPVLTEIVEPQSAAAPAPGLEPVPAAPVNGIIDTLLTPAPAAPQEAALSLQPIEPREAPDEDSFTAGLTVDPRFSTPLSAATPFDTLPMVDVIPTELRSVGTPPAPDAPDLQAQPEPFAAPDSFSAIEPFIGVGTFAPAANTERPPASAPTPFEAPQAFVGVPDPFADALPFVEPQAYAETPQPLDEPAFTEPGALIEPQLNEGVAAFAVVESHAEPMDLGLLPEQDATAAFDLREPFLGLDAPTGAASELPAMEPLPVADAFTPTPAITPSDIATAAPPSIEPIPASSTLPSDLPNAALLQQRLAEQLVDLDTVLARALEDWFRTELPPIVAREITRLNERIREEAVGHLRATLLPRLSEEVSRHLGHQTPRAD